MTSTQRHHCSELRWVTFGRTAILLLQFVVAPAALASNEIQKPEFTMTLHDGWIEVPRSILDKWVERTRQLEHSTSKDDIRLAYAFHPPEKGWFELPNITVEILSTGRLTEADLDYMYLSDVTELEKQERKKAPSEVRNFHLSVPEYDRSTDIAWFTATGNTSYEGNLTAIAACVPTEQGLIRVRATAKTIDYPKYEETFRKYLGTLKADPSIAYKHSLLHAPVPKTKAGAFALLVAYSVALLLGVTVVVYLVRNWLSG